MKRGTDWHAWAHVSRDYVSDDNPEGFSNFATRQPGTDPMGRRGAWVRVKFTAVIPRKRKRAKK
jgi:hypothetical protein